MASEGNQEGTKKERSREGWPRNPGHPEDVEPLNLSWCQLAQL